MESDTTFECSSIKPSRHGEKRLKRKRAIPPSATRFPRECKSRPVELAGSHLRVLLVVELFLDFRERVDRRSQVVLELEDGLAVACDVDLIVGVLQYVDLVLVGEDARRGLAEALLRDVAVADIVAGKLSRGQGERIGGELVHARARLRQDLLLLRLVIQSVDDLVVEDVEAHGGQRHAEHYVARAEPDRRVASLLEAVARIGTRYQVSEPDCAQAHETEVARVCNVSRFHHHNQHRHRHSYYYYYYYSTYLFTLIYTTIIGFFVVVGRENVSSMD